ncbi:hypothetical protein HYH03_000869 [Edaphochlamys debaryana]|uniref:S-acyltransferase n=1 Tax=Edaphochlamys debaryana TaxID=47281 RepID=A0A835YM52_9CHLO|nr:hypothetical protein HYH03_000869 [Edaphochlamys debaryana]|eukprot:KAG2501050.1 hypothetical protein HYH03_000869 [Edaphochlamys debaryana]
MDLFLFAIGYAMLTGFFIFILLFGESPVFRGTPIASAHWFLTQGLCNGGEYLVARVFGARGSQALDRAYSACCERPNPFLQVAYLAMLAVGLWIYWTNLFALLPNPWVGEEHILTGTAAVAVCLAFFVAACASDPGTIRASDPPSVLAAWHVLYPLDGHVFPAKQCATCGFERPARSKHCGVCGKCVGRHDHHCAWINNCVGLKNIRLFLAFLVVNLAMCSYGALLSALILGGEMERRGVFEVKLINYRTGRVVPMWKVPTKVMEWLVFYHPLGVAMFLFMCIATLLMAAFLSYQLYLFSVGRTQYEMFKWRDLHHQMIEQAEADAEEEARRQEETARREADPAAADASASAPADAAPSGRRSLSRGSGRGSGGVWTLWGLLGGRKRRLNVEVPPLPRNIYHKGFAANLWEVLMPELHLDRARKQALAEARAAKGSQKQEGEAAGVAGKGQGGGSKDRGSKKAR